MNLEFLACIPFFWILTEFWFDRLAPFAQLENQLEQKVLQERCRPQAAFEIVPEAGGIRRLLQPVWPLSDGALIRFLIFSAIALPWAGKSEHFFPPILILFTWAICFTIARIDFRWYIIPDELNWLGLGIGISYAAAAQIFTQPTISLTQSLLGAILSAGTLMAIATLCTRFLGREAMGGGDIKLMLFLGSILGVQGGLMTLALSSLTGSFFGIFFLIKSRFMEKKKGMTMIAFGPWIILAAMITAWFGPEALLQKYLAFSETIVRDIVESY